jgi:Immunity protein 22
MASKGSLSVANEFSRVHIWLGDFSPPESLNDYVAERQEHYKDESDTVPISQFAADMNEWFIDHDFICIMFVEEATTDIRYLLQKSLISSDFGDETLAQKYLAEHGQSVNGIILVYGDEVQKPTSVTKENYKVYYIGRFYDSSSENL